MSEKRLNRLPRERILKRRLLIQALYDRDNQEVFSVSKGCIRVIARLISFEEAGTSGPFMVGFTVGKRIGPAVVRNRIKRLMRESFRNHQQTVRALDLGGCLTLVLLFRGGISQISDIGDDVPNALQLLSGTCRHQAEL